MRERSFKNVTRALLLVALWALFTAMSARAQTTTQTILGEKFSSVTFCELERQRMVEQYPKTLESKCVQNESLFLPVLIVVNDDGKNADEPGNDIYRDLMQTSAKKVTLQSK